MSKIAVGLLRSIRNSTRSAAIVYRWWAWCGGARQCWRLLYNRLCLLLDIFCYVFANDNLPFGTNRLALACLARQTSSVRLLAVRLTIDHLQAPATGLTR